MAFARSLLAASMTLFMLSIDGAAIYAQSLLFAPAAGAVQTKIGVVAGVNGHVEILSPGRVGKLVESGQPVFLGDEVSTDGEGQLQILLMDETVFTIGPNSTIVIDEFVYNPATQEGKIDARMIQGMFRLVTGNIAKKKPENVQIKLPSGSVGIRGTILYGKVEGESSLLLLLGPGEKNNTAHRKGAIVVQNEVGGKMIRETVNKSGFGSEIKGKDSPPAPAFKVSQEQVREMTSRLNMPKKQESKQEASEKDAGEKSGSAEGNRGEDSTRAQSKSGQTRLSPAAGSGIAAALVERSGSATELSGQSFIESLRSLSDVMTVNDLGSALMDQSVESSRDSFTGSFQFSPGITTLEQMTGILTGTARYAQSEVPLFNQMSQLKGYYGIFLEVDFQNKRIGGGDSKVTVNATGIGAGPVHFNLTSFQYGSSGPAVFFLNGLSSSNCANCSLDLNLVFMNDEQRLAASVNHEVQVTDSFQGTTLSGSGAALPTFSTVDIISVE